MAKEKTIVELQAEHASLRSASKGILESAQTEKRALTETENATLQGNQLRMAEINLEIEQRNAESRSQAVENKQKRGFSLVRAIRNQMEGRAQEDTEAEVMERAADRQGNLDHNGMLIPFSAGENRSALTTTNAQTYGYIDQDNMEIVLPLEKQLVLAQAGATIMTGLKGNLQFPGMSDVTVAWDAENDNASDGTPTISSALNLTPKRLCAYVDISKQLLVQENRDIEGYIRQLISIAIAQKLESTLLGKAAAGDGPAGLFNTKPTIKGSFSWPNVVDMEEAVLNAGGVQGGAMGYILHSKLYAKAKVTAKEAVTGAGGLVMDGNNAMLNGYRCFVTGNVANELETAPAVGSTPAVNDGYGAIFGNFADLVIGNWGNLDIVVDPYTQGIGGKVRLIVNSYWNGGVTRSGSFKTAALK